MGSNPTRYTITNIKELVMCSPNDIDTFVSLASKHRHIEDVPAKCGFEFCGEGSFGSVYKKGNSVVKIFSDRGYLLWMLFCAENQGNVFVPRLFSDIYFINSSNMMFVFMEYLEHKSSKVTEAEKIFRYDHVKESDGVDIYSVAAEICSNNHIEDLHTENIMFREEQAVVTDPYADFDYDYVSNGDEIVKSRSIIRL